MSNAEIVAGESAPSTALYFKADITPENLFQALGRLRKEAFDEIERLLCFLDECDGDENLEPYLGNGQNGGDDREAEPESDEPALGWTETEARWGRYPKINEQHEGEPSLGSPQKSYHDQTKWTEGNHDDREGDGCADDREGDEEEHGGDEHDGRESDEPEPSLGSVEAINQERWAQGSGGFIDAELQDHKLTAPKRRGKALPSINTARHPCLGRDMIDGLTREQADALSPRLSNASHFGWDGRKPGGVSIGRVKE